jgi:UTP--glucose-1-phosphate uridylyltransferase
VPVVRKAVLPVAGLGTRFLPATKAVPKEMLPLVDRPAIQYIVEECVRAELDDVLFVTGMGKVAIEDHFDRVLDLEAALASKGKEQELSLVRDLADLVVVHSVRQPEPLGLGHAVLMAADHVDAATPLLERMVAAHERTGQAVVALMEVPEDQTHLYGVARTEPGEADGEVLITGMVEKPDPGEAPSNLAVIGRYVLPGEVFGVLERTPPGRGGEIQLTDALQSMAEKQPLVGVILDAPRYDAGDKLGFLKATVQLAAERDDLGPAFLAWLRDWMEERDSRERGRS